MPVFSTASTVQPQFVFTKTNQHIQPSDPLRQQSDRTPQQGITNKSLKAESILSHTGQ